MQGVRDYKPKPADLSNMNLSRDLALAAEKIAENSHLIWAKKTLDDIVSKGSPMLATLLPWDLLTDGERKKNRFRAQEVIKFLQYYGYRISPPELKGGEEQLESDRANVEKRFAYNLLEKLYKYMDTAGGKMKPLKPSQGFTRRRSFTKASKDIKFFGKVVLPLMQAYFKAHQLYFLTSSVASSAGVASNKEKEMVAGLFCRLAALLRRKNHAFGVDAKITVKCLQVLVQSMDCRTLVKMNSDLLRTSILMFFNNCADDLTGAVKDIRDTGQYAQIRGANLKSWPSLEYANQVTMPVLTALYNHLAKNNFGADLLVEDVQVACYKILDSLYFLTSLLESVRERISIAGELDKHRPALGSCLSAFAKCFPVAFLEPDLNANNRLSVLTKMAGQSVQAQEMLNNLSAHIPTLDKLMAEIEAIAEKAEKYTDRPAAFDVDLPLICSYLTYWHQFGPEGSAKAEKNITNVVSEHMNRTFAAILKLNRDNIGFQEAPWLCRVASFTTQIINHVTSDPVKELMLPICEQLKASSEGAWREEERARTHPDETDEASVAEVIALFPQPLSSLYYTWGIDRN